VRDRGVGGIPGNSGTREYGIQNFCESEATPKMSKGEVAVPCSIVKTGTTFPRKFQKVYCSPKPKNCSVESVLYCKETVVGEN
jgi:hypothetical protein